MTSELKALLRAQNFAFKSCDRVQFSITKSDLRRGVKAENKEYKRKVESYLEDNSRKVWQGIHHLTNYKGNLPVAVNVDAALAEELSLIHSLRVTQTCQI